MVLTNNNLWDVKGHCVAWLWLIMWVVPPKGFVSSPISDLFLTYVQCFDIILQINPKLTPRIGPSPEPVRLLFVLKWAHWADGTYLGDIIPLTQICTYADLVPRQIHNWPGRIAQLTMWNSGLTSTLARSCILCWLCLRFRLVNLWLRQLLYTFYLMFYCRINDHMKSYCIELCDIIVTCTIRKLGRH